MGSSSGKEFADAANAIEDAAAEPGPEQDCLLAKCHRLAIWLKDDVDDPHGVLDLIVNRAKDPKQVKEALALLERIEGEVTASTPKFAGKPKLELTTVPVRAIRASGDFTGDPIDGLDPTGAIINPVTGKTRQGHEQGAWLSDSPDREANAILWSWDNPMDIIEVHEIPPGSVILRGTAAPMVEKRSGAMAKEDLPMSGGANQICHLGQCPPDGPISSKAAVREVVGTPFTMTH